MSQNPTNPFPIFAIMTHKELEDFVYQSLVAFYDDREAQSLTKWLLLHYAGQHFYARKAAPFSEERLPEVRKAISRLMAYEPVQYVVGNVDFYGLELAVAPTVLIPRPETEELVDWVVQGEARAERIVDIGTGSGCIALGIKKGLPHATVTGLDSSADALEVAQKNAGSNALEATFEQHDILTESLLPFAPADVIVSNPPYVLEAERRDLSQSITRYEPEVAIFVPDDDPFIFYMAIARKAKEVLKPGGRLYFEYHERYFNQVKAILQVNDYREIEIKEDLQGKKRMIRGRN